MPQLYRIIEVAGKFYLSPVYGSGDLPTDEIIAGPIDTYSEAEKVAEEFSALDRKYSL